MFYNIKYLFHLRVLDHCFGNQVFQDRSQQIQVIRSLRIVLVCRLRDKPHYQFGPKKKKKPRTQLLINSNSLQLVKYLNENVLDNLVDKKRKRKNEIEISRRNLLCSSPIKTKPKKEKRSTTLSEVGSTSNHKNRPVNNVPILKRVRGIFSLFHLEVPSLVFELLQYFFFLKVLLQYISHSFLLVSIAH